MANASNFTFKDNTDIILDRIYAATKESAQEMADTARDAVQWQILYGYKDPHGKDGHTEIVDTGALFDSIKGEVRRVSGNDYEVTVGTDRKYAVYVHEGTRYLKARRFITDGIRKCQKELRNILERNYKNG